MTKITLMIIGFHRFLHLMASAHLFIYLNKNPYSII